MKNDKELVLLTGASGFIGSALIARLADRYTIVGLDRAGPPEPAAPAHAIDIDLASDDPVRGALQQVRERFGSRIACVIHLAAYYDISGEPNPLYEEVTVQGTRRLIDALEGFEVEQFVFASTMLVHRPTGRPDERVDESSPVEPSWAYPESKVRTENLLLERRGSIPLVRLRIAGVYDDVGHSPFIAEQIARIYEHRLVSHFYPGMLCAGQSFLHVEDLAEAVARLIERRRQLPDEMALLVGEAEALGYAEIQDIVGRALHGEGWSTLRVPEPLAKAGSWLQNDVLGDDPFIKPWMVEQASAHYVLDIGKARRLLDWAPRHSLKEALPKIVAALQRDPTGWYKANKLNPALVAWYGQRPSARREGTQHERMQPAGMAHGGMASSGPDHMSMMEEETRSTRWAHFANIGLGLWLAASPLVYDAQQRAAP